ncbi:MAG: MFS transporter, partial [Chloroflexota bacterium]
MTFGSLRSRTSGAARDYGARLRAFSPDARLFLAATVLGGINIGVSSVLLNLYIVSLGYGEAFLGSVLRFGPIGAVLGAVLAGPLVDGWGAKRTMLAGTALVGGGAVALLVSPDPLVLRSGIALVNMGGALVYIAVPPFLARHSSPHERTHLFAVATAAYVLSTAGGSALGGVLPGLVSSVGPAFDEAQVFRIALFGGAVL